VEVAALLRQTLALEVLEAAVVEAQQVLELLEPQT